MARAPGIWLEDERGRWVAMLPGVPREMRGMLGDTLLPRLAARMHGGRRSCGRSRCAPPASPSRCLPISIESMGGGPLGATAGVSARRSRASTSDSRFATFCRTRRMRTLDAVPARLRDRLGSCDLRRRGRRSRRRGARPVPRARAHDRRRRELQRRPAWRAPHRDPGLERRLSRRRHRLRQRRQARIARRHRGVASRKRRRERGGRSGDGGWGAQRGRSTSVGLGDHRRRRARRRARRRSRSARFGSRVDIRGRRSRRSCCDSGATATRSASGRRSGRSICSRRRSSSAPSWT